MILLFSLAIGSLALCYSLVYAMGKSRVLPSFLSSAAQKQAVSLIICARNEADALPRNIPKWLAQEEVDLQLILVNDHSIDSTAQEARRLCLKYPELQYVELSSPLTAGLGKKHALLQGLKYVRNPLLAFSDADCWPASPRTLQLMAAPFVESSVQVVLGMAPMAPAPPRLLNELQVIDQTLTAIQMSHFARKGKAYMALGRNVMYSASQYNPEALANSMKYLAGDDDLAFQSMQLQQVEVVAAPEAHVYSPGCGSWKAWFRQKRRHYSVVPGYRGAAVRWLSLLRASQLAVLLLLVPALLNAPVFAGVALGVVWFWGLGLMYSAASAYQLPIRKTSLLLEPLRFTFVMLVVVSFVFKPVKSW